MLCRKRQTSGARMSKKQRIEKAVASALKSCIVAHGPITLEWIGSATKRIVGAAITAPRNHRVKASKLEPKHVMPQTPAEWCAYRCQLSCKIGRDALEGKTQLPAGCSPLEYAMFSLLHAVEDLAAYISCASAKAGKQTKQPSSVAAEKRKEIALKD